MRGSGFLLSEDRTKAFCLFVCLMHFVGAATLLPCDLEAGFLFDGVQVVTFLAPDWLLLGFVLLTTAAGSTTPAAFDLVLIVPWLWGEGNKTVRAAARFLDWHVFATGKSMSSEGSRAENSLFHQVWIHLLSLEQPRLHFLYSHLRLNVFHLHLPCPNHCGSALSFLHATEEKENIASDRLQRSWLERSWVIVPGWVMKMTFPLTFQCDSSLWCRNVCPSKKILSKIKRTLFLGNTFWEITEKLVKRSRFDFFCRQILAMFVEAADSASSARLKSPRFKIRTLQLSFTLSPLYFPKEFLNPINFFQPLLM